MWCIFFPRNISFKYRDEVIATDKDKIEIIADNSPVVG
jgi:hypothetical protein